MCIVFCFFFFKQKTAYEMRISYWSSDVCSSDLPARNLLYAASCGRSSQFFHGEQSVFKGLKPIIYGGREVWPLIEGGKGVAVSNHMSSGAWAAAGGIGTVSAVNADSRSEEHTSELQSLMRISYAVFCLKKKQHTNTQS